MCILCHHLLAAKSWCSSCSSALFLLSARWGKKNLAFWLNVVDAYRIKLEQSENCFCLNQLQSGFPKWKCYCLLFVSLTLSWFSPPASHLVFLCTVPYVQCSTSLTVGVLLSVTAAGTEAERLQHSFQSLYHTPHTQWPGAFYLWIAGQAECHGEIFGLKPQERPSCGHWSQDS